MNIFPKVQFIVSTHAPAIISSVKTDKLRILSNKEVCMTANQVYGKDVNSVMKEIMGVMIDLINLLSFLRSFIGYFLKKI